MSLKVATEINKQNKAYKEPLGTLQSNGLLSERLNIAHIYDRY
jgi:hypothetical protein